MATKKKEHVITFYSNNTQSYKIKVLSFISIYICTTIHKASALPWWPMAWTSKGPCMKPLPILDVN